MTTTEDVKRYRKFQQGEVDGIHYYTTLAALEEDEQLATVYRDMAKMEQRHLAVWEAELERAGVLQGRPSPTRKARALMWVARRFGTDTVLPILKANEVGADNVYASEPIALAAQLPGDERTHARVVAALGGPNGGLSDQQSVASSRDINRSAAATRCVQPCWAATMGSPRTSRWCSASRVRTPATAPLILAGVAGLLAGAFSMALGEWISVMSAREAAEAQIAAEREEIELMPDAERDELALIYRAKGVPEQQARELAEHVMADRESALSVLSPRERSWGWSGRPRVTVDRRNGLVHPLRDGRGTPGTAVLLRQRPCGHPLERGACGHRPVPGGFHDHAADGSQPLVCRLPPAGAGPGRRRDYVRHRRTGGRRHGHLVDG